MTVVTEMMLRKGTWLWGDFSFKMRDDYKCYFEWWLNHLVLPTMFTLIY